VPGPSRREGRGQIALLPGPRGGKGRKGLRYGSSIRNLNPTRAENRKGERREEGCAPQFRKFQRREKKRKKERKDYNGTCGGGGGGLVFFWGFFGGRPLPVRTGKKKGKSRDRKLQKNQVKKKKRGRKGAVPHGQTCTSCFQKKGGEKRSASIGRGN